MNKLRGSTERRHARPEIVVLAVVLGLTCTQPALADAKPSDASGSDVQDVIFLGDARPLFIRLHLTVNGKPLRQVWRDYLDRMFDELDRDHDGVLDKEEAARAPDLTAGGVAFRVAANRGSPLTQAADAAGKISREAFIAYHRRAAAPFTTRQGQGGVRAAAALFSLLDSDGDHQLSADELRAAERTLRRRDFDDDEIIMEQELVAGQIPYGTGFVVVQSAGQPGQTPSGLVFVIEPDMRPAELATALMRRYDSNKDGSLAGPQSQSPEIVLDPVAFAQLDSNGNGSLDAEELGRFAERRPDVELRFAMGTETLADAEQEAQSNDRPPSSITGIRRLVSGTYEIDTGDVRLRIEKNNANPRNTGQQFAQLFRQFDADNNGYIDEAEAKGNPFINNLFQVMDRDGDGKVFKEEFDSYFDRLNDAAATRLALEVADNGQELFQMLDTDHDGRLTIRELRAAPDLLNRLDTDHDGRLSGNEIPRNIAMVLGRGVSSSNLAGRAVIFSSAAMRQQSPRVASPAGPLWFRKMDRNHDGDLSPREFLGSREDFDRLDANHDGLIDAKEAEAASQNVER